MKPFCLNKAQKGHEEILPSRTFDRGWHSYFLKLKFSLVLMSPIIHLQVNHYVILTLTWSICKHFHFQTGFKLWTKFLADFYSWKHWHFTLKETCLKMFHVQLTQRGGFLHRLLTTQWDSGSEKFLSLPFFKEWRRLAHLKQVFPVCLYNIQCR